MNQILLPKEVELLLDSVEGTTHELEPDSPHRPISLVGEERIVRGRLPGLEVIAEAFARVLRADLTRHLGRNVGVTVAGVGTEKLSPYFNRIEHPSSIHLFRMPPLPGQAALVCPPIMVDAVVEASFGGSPLRRTRKRTTGREFTAIENRLMAKAAAVMLEAFKEAWAPLYPIECVYVRAEYNPLTVSLGTASDSAMVIAIGLELDPTTAPISICLPSALLGPIKEKLGSGAMRTSTLDRDHRTEERIRGKILAAKVNVAAELASGRIKVRDFLQLTPGLILPLGTPANAPATILVEGAPKFEATIGEHHGSRAAKVLRRR
ncbi:MAG: FliM/FliN family flagellar motor switch protein [Bdellovibrionales bacterium]|nr:FliM/FliN family flagellar motor switch protein [Bdellovibrionales bacterium]